MSIVTYPPERSSGNATDHDGVAVDQRTGTGIVSSAFWPTGLSTPRKPVGEHQAENRSLVFPLKRCGGEKGTVAFNPVPEGERSKLHAATTCGVRVALPRTPDGPCGGVGFTLLDYTLTQAERGVSSRSPVISFTPTKFYKYRMVRSGNIIETYEYETTQYSKSGQSQAGRKEPKEMTEEEKKEKRRENLSRARKGLIRTINANAGDREKERPKFFTMTYGEDHILFEVKEGNYEFKKFIQRLEYFVRRNTDYPSDYKIRYTAITRFQDGNRPGGKDGGRGGAIHHHVVFYNLPFISHKKLSEIWNRGFVWINAIDDVDNLGVYVVEGYMGKEMDDERLNGQKHYWSSRGLLKPTQRISMKPFQGPEVNDDHLVKTATYENDYVGTVTYRQYNLKRIGGIYERKKKSGSSKEERNGRQDIGGNSHERREGG